MTTAAKYIEELDARMSKTEKHITACELALTKDHSKDYKQAVERNLKVSLNMHDRLHDEIVGMVDFRDEHGNDKFVIDFGWERYLPQHLKGMAGATFYHDSTRGHESLEHTGATQEDFEFW